MAPAHDGRRMKNKPATNGDTGQEVSAGNHIDNMRGKWCDLIKKE
ncbi:MAG: hypothetical protein ABI472_04885 [Ginsengibacter sp.]